MSSAVLSIEPHALKTASHGPAGRWVLLCPTHEPARCWDDSDGHGNGPSDRHGRTEETHKHYNGVCISDYLLVACLASLVMLLKT